MMSKYDRSYFATLIWQIADLLRGCYPPPQYERVMLPMTVLRYPGRADVVWAEPRSSAYWPASKPSQRIERACRPT